VTRFICSARPRISLGFLGVDIIARIPAMTDYETDIYYFAFWFWLWLLLYVMFAFLDGKWW
jgi:hypothetical protein